MASKAKEIKVTELIELVGADELLAQNQYSDEVAAAISGSGEIVQAIFYSTGGDELQVEGRLLIFDTAPTIDLGDTTLTVAEHKTLCGRIPVATANYGADAGGAIAVKDDIHVVFHQVTNLYLAFFLTSATSINSAAGDNEVLQVRLWYRPE
jgi:hypothetical protein